MLSYISITLVGLGFLLKEEISFGAAKNLNAKEQDPHPSSFIPHPSSSIPHPSPENG
jgi:hypothetical protein